MIRVALNLAFGSLGIKVLALLLVTRMGLSMRVAAFIMLAIVMWRLVVIYRAGRRENFTIEWAQHVAAIAKDKQQWVWVSNHPQQREEVVDGVTRTDDGVAGGVIASGTASTPAAQQERARVQTDAYVVGGPWLPRGRHDLREFRRSTGDLAERQRRFPPHLHHLARPRHG